MRLFTELKEKNHALTHANEQVTEALDQQTATAEILRVISQSQTNVQPVFEAIAALASLARATAAIAEFERDLIRERVVAGIVRARAQDRRLGRPQRNQVDIAEARALVAEGLSLHAVARPFNAHPMAVRRALI